jgi:hypothetical protein
VLKLASLKVLKRSAWGVEVGVEALWEDALRGGRGGDGDLRCASGIRSTGSSDVRTRQTLSREVGGLFGEGSESLVKRRMSCDHPRSYENREQNA